MWLEVIEVQNDGDRRNETREDSGTNEGRKKESGDTKYKILR